MSYLYFGAGFFLNNSGKSIQIANIKKAIEKVTPEMAEKITSLEIVQNISEIPKKFLPEGLEEIMIDSATLWEIPKEIYKLKKLRVLSITKSSVGVIDENIANLQSLTALNLSGNALNCLPKAIKELKNLKILDLSNNWLGHQFPPELMSMELEVLIIPNSIEVPKGVMANNIKFAADWNHWDHWSD